MPSNDMLAELKAITPGSNYRNINVQSALPIKFIYKSNIEHWFLHITSKHYFLATST